MIIHDKSYLQVTTSLHLAVMEGNVKIVDQFIGFRAADLYAEDYLGRWPVHLAYSTGNAEMIKLLEYHTFPENGQLPDIDPFDD